MFGFHGHRDAVWLQCRNEGIGDLRGESLLELRAPCYEVDQAGDFADADDATAGDIGHVGAAVEGEEVMLAHGEERNIAQDDHLRMAFLKSNFEEFGGVDAKTAEDFGISVGDAARGIPQPLAVGIFADGEEHLADGGFNPGRIERLGIRSRLQIQCHGSPTFCAPRRAGSQRVAPARESFLP